jgi:hypothetical protein
MNYFSRVVGSKDTTPVQGNLIRSLGETPVRFITNPMDDVLDIEKMRELIIDSYRRAHLPSLIKP